ncbi:hypothetical protein CBR_g50396 [Chara braunii]|uniref:Uncharacterized protein n=1 Tax=Chara braunii TaxID=69332 RepID=A0A388M6J5_CHABU|nr:hypothetical protein CBR_g50396 [Chara braunii]|eukprot:GBG90217.1 hypothetical protein CBR_g50396 [Chara braunii]
MNCKSKGDDPGGGGDHPKGPSIYSHGGFPVASFSVEVGKKNRNFGSSSDQASPNPNAGGQRQQTVGANSSGPSVPPTGPCVGTTNRSGGSRSSLNNGQTATTFAASRSPSLAPITPPPKPLLLVFPATEGEYPVLVFQHGFCLVNSYYSQLLQHVASYGFIVVAPQMYTISGPDATREIADAAKVISWMERGLAASFPEPFQHTVRPNLSKLALAGHSRGGKVVFGIAKGTTAPISLNISALIGIDPVDGTGQGKSIPPPVLNFSKNSFGFSLPTLVIGSGLGPIPKGLLLPPCAPAEVGHRVYYADSSPPKYHCVLKDFGHMDFLDDCTKGLRGTLSYCVCKNGSCRKLARRFTGGLLVAFLKAVLLQDREDLDTIFNRPALAPIQLSLLEKEEIVQAGSPAIQKTS